MSSPKPISQRHHVHWPSLHWVWSRAYRVLGFGFGSGLMRPGSGTWGSILALVLWWPLAHWINPTWLAWVLVAFSLGGIWICKKCTDDLGVADHVGVVWDEMVSVWLVLWAVPAEIWTMALGFLLFRFFDILKPPPIRQLDAKVGGGFGVMLDDWVAGLYAVALTWLAWLLTIHA